jgi:hypothetical protein
VQLHSRIRIPILLAALSLLICPYASGASASGSEQSSLSAEADRLTYEILELKARRRAAQVDREALAAEVARLNMDITGVEEEMDMLADELEECRLSYGRSLRTMYKRGEVSELEVILGARELEELWEDTAYLDRIARSEMVAAERLKAKISEVDLKGRELRDIRAKRQRVKESLDEEFLDARISELEGRLSEVSARLRAMAGGGGERRESPPDPAGWTVPPPGKLLSRVPTMPPISDFERTGMVYSGYTTHYGADFHGRSTASGVVFNMYDFTCAHRTLPFGTWLLVTFQGRQTIVQVNDRGPFVPGRVLDLSFGSAQSIGLDGVKWAEFEILIPRG